MNARYDYSCWRIFVFAAILKLIIFNIFRGSIKLNFSTLPNWIENIYIQIDAFNRNMQSFNRWRTSIYFYLGIGGWLWKYNFSIKIENTCMLLYYIIMTDEDTVGIKTDSQDWYKCMFNPLQKLYILYLVSQSTENSS